MIDQVARASATTQSGVAHAVMSPTGTLAYAPRTWVASRVRNLTFVDKGGKNDRSVCLRKWYVHPRVSPDGHQLVFAIEDSKDVNIWVTTLRRWNHCAA